MADIDDLFGELRRAVKGCPEPTMADALLRAARTFSAETWLLRRAYAFTTVAGQQQYALQAPPNEEVIAVKHAQLGAALPPVEPALAPRSRTGDPAPAGGGGGSTRPLRFVYPTLIDPDAAPARPHSICYVPYDTVALAPVPDDAYPVELELITQPTAGTRWIADELCRKWDQALGYGALEWLLRMPGDPWYNPPAADEYLRLFGQQIVRARGEAAFDFTPNQRRWLRAGFGERR